MSRLLVVVARDGRLEGALADEVHDTGSARVFTLAGVEVARVRPEESCTVRAVPARRFPALDRTPIVAAAG